MSRREKKGLKYCGDKNARQEPQRGGGRRACSGGLPDLSYDYSRKEREKVGEKKNGKARDGGGERKSY